MNFHELPDPERLPMLRDDLHERMQDAVDSFAVSPHGLFHFGVTLGGETRAYGVRLYDDQDDRFAACSCHLFPAQNFCPHVRAVLAAEESGIVEVADVVDATGQTTVCPTCRQDRACPAGEAEDVAQVVRGP